MVRSYDLKYEFGDKNEGIPSKMYSSVDELHENYQKDIGGCSMIEISDYALLIKDGEKPIGFLLGSKCFNEIVKDEKSFSLIAAYITPEYRNKTGKHKDVLKNSLNGLVDILGEKEFDRLNIIPDLTVSKLMVTKIGEDHVIKPLYYLLLERGKKEVEGKDEEYKNRNGHLRNFGSSQLHKGFNPIWLFHAEEYLEKMGVFKQ